MAEFRKSKQLNFSDEEIEEMLRKAESNKRLDLTIFDQNICECGDSIERIGLSDYYLHLHHGKLFDKVSKKSTHTNCETPKPRRMH